MKKVIFFSLIVFLSFTAFSQQSIVFQSTGEDYEISLVSSTADYDIIKFQLNRFDIVEEQSNLGFVHRILLDGAAKRLEAKAPSLPIVSKSLIIDHNASLKFEVVSSSDTIISNKQIIPSKGNLYRDIDPSSIPLEFGKAYSQNLNFPPENIELGNPYIFRDYSGVSIKISPFQFNPITKQLLIHKELIIKVWHKNGNAGNISTVDQEFDKMYQSHFLNYKNSKYTPLSEIGKMLIIAPSNFITAVQPLADWKNKSGIPTEIVDLATIGSYASQIKSYVQTYYNNNGLTFVLLVGDAADVPTNTITAGHSDNAYGYLSGNDSYPELIVGRLSGETETQIQNMVTRTLLYEMNPPSGNWAAHNIGIASSQGPGDDNEYDYQHIRNLQTDLLGYTYTSSSEFFDGSQGGLDASGNPSSSMVGNDLNLGAGLINYTGHGSTTSFSTSGFNVSDVNALTNTGGWPFIWAVACVNGNFVNNTCFAEAWIRASYNGQPTGAIATLMSTINQSWDPPMDAQDEMVDILTESFSNNIKRTFGGISMNGCMKMNDDYGSQGDEMTDTWNCFGDPSVMVRTDSAKILMVTHPPVLFLGQNSLSAYCNTNEALLTLSKDGVILVSQTIGATPVTINFTSPILPDSLDIVVTAFNHIPYISKLPLIPSNSPYLIPNSVTIDDTQGNQNLKADYGEQIAINLELKNVGVFNADSVTAFISSADPFISVVQNNQFFGMIESDSALLINTCFQIQIDSFILDQHQSLVDLQLSDDSGNVWNHAIHITLSAPDINIISMTIDDSEYGNGDNNINPGEAFRVDVYVKNNGSSDAGMIESQLSVNNPNLQLVDTILYSSELLIGNLDLKSFYMIADTSLGTGSQLDIICESGFTSYRDTASIELMIGKANEDFETADFQKFPWVLSGSAQWAIDSLIPFEGNYDAKSQNIGNNQMVQMQLTVNSASADSISFMYKVSCEEGGSSKWDYLEFFIDGVSKDWWDGITFWERASYPVSAGQHTFKWVYEKDGYVSEGEDCAWVDFITLPPIEAIPYLSAFATYDQHQVNEQSGYAINTLEPGDSASIDLGISNIGFDTIFNSTVQLYCLDSAVEIINGSQVFGDMLPSSTILKNDAFDIYISDTTSVSRMVSFKAVVSDQFGNTWDVHFSEFIDISLGIEPIVEKPTMKLFPNPATDEINVEFDQIIDGKLKLEIIDIHGRVHLSRMVEDLISTTSSNRIKINASTLPAGFYFLRMKYDEGNLTKPVIINK